MEHYTSFTAARLEQSSMHVTAPPLSIFCFRLQSHLFSHFLIPLLDSSLFSHLYSARAVARHFGHYNRFYIFIIYKMFKVSSAIIALTRRLAS